MAELNPAQSGLSFGEYLVLKALALGELPDERHANSLIKLERRGLIRADAVPAGYSLTDDGKDTYEAHAREWQRARSEMGLTVRAFASTEVQAGLAAMATGLETVNWMRDVPSLFEQVGLALDTTTLMQQAIAPLHDQLEKYLSIAQQPDFAVALDSMRPAISAIESFKSLTVNPNDILSAAAHVSEASSLVMRLGGIGVGLGSDILKRAEDYSRSLSNIAAIWDSRPENQLWNAYLGSLDRYSGAVVDWARQSADSQPSTTLQVNNAASIGRTLVLASIPPAYDVGEVDSDGIYEVSEPIEYGIYGGEDISRTLEGISPKYKKHWDGILYALDERNPARVKQVAYSARDLIQTYVDEFAPEDLVRNALGKDKPTRRERIAYILSSDGREQLVWVVDHLDALVVSLDSTMSTIGHDRQERPGDDVSMRALVGLVGHALVLLETNRKR